MYVLVFTWLYLVVDSVLQQGLRDTGTSSLMQPRRTQCVSRSRTVLVVRATSKFEAGNPYAQELRDTAKYIARRGRGILASDESNMTTGKRLATVDVENTPDNRRDWRQVLYTAPGLGNYISGALACTAAVTYFMRALLPVIVQPPGCFLHEKLSVTLE